MPVRTFPGLFRIAACGVLLTAICASSGAVTAAPPPFDRASIIDGAERSLARAAIALDRSVLRLALGAVACAVRSGEVIDPPTLTVIDYSRPSTEKRLWVFDLRTLALLFEDLVAHGAGSGEDLATRFSNQEGTHRTSLGLFRTADTYVGNHGYSLRLDGLETGFNDRARARRILMHGAAYVSEALARARGRLGRSWGCPAVPQQSAPAIIDRVKDGSLLFAYYPDPIWLSASRFLGACRSAG